MNQNVDNDQPVPFHARVEKHRTINLGNYESEKIIAGLSMTVDPELDPEETMKKLSAHVNNFLDEEQEITLQKRKIALSTASNANSSNRYRISQTTE